MVAKPPNQEELRSEWVMNGGSWGKVLCSSSDDYIHCNPSNPFFYAKFYNINNCNIFNSAAVASCVLIPGLFPRQKAVWSCLPLYYRAERVVLCISSRYCRLYFPVRTSVILHYKISSNWFDKCIPKDKSLQFF